MPTQKDFKRLVRGRMQKTGESYTSARAQLLRRRRPAETPQTPRTRSSVPAASPPAADAPAPTPYAQLAGMSDKAIEARTGRAWAAWVETLDSRGAGDWPHRKIAAFVQETYGVADWWTQAVTVGYERIKGLRDKGQRRGGAYETSRSRTFQVPVDTLYRAFAVARARARWLPGVKVTVRKATPPKSVRMTWPDGTSVEVWLTSKGTAKAQVAVQHRKLPDRAAVARMKEYWGARFDVLER